MKRTFIHAVLVASFMAVGLMGQAHAKSTSPDGATRVLPIGQISGTSAKVTVNVQKAPLRDVVARVAKLGKANVVGLERIPPSDLVSMRLADKPDAILRRLLEGREVMFVQDAGGELTLAILDREKRAPLLTSESSEKSDVTPDLATVAPESRFGGRLMRGLGPERPGEPNVSQRTTTDVGAGLRSASNNSFDTQNAATAQASATASILGDAGKGIANPVLAAQERVKAMVFSLNRAAELNKADGGGKPQP